MSAKTKSSRAAVQRRHSRYPPSRRRSSTPVFAALRKRVPKAQQAQAEAFARAFYRRMSRRGISRCTARKAWAALAADFLDLARARKPGTAEVRVFNASLKQHGLESPHTVVQIVNDDMPFLVDSVTMALAEQGIGVHVLGHPVVHFQRDKAGKLLAVGEGTPESLIHLEIDRQPAEAMAGIERTIQARTGRRARDRRRLERDALEDAGDRRRPRHAQDAGVPTPAARKRRNSCAGPRTTTSPSSAIANTKSSSRAARKCCARSKDRASACCVARTRASRAPLKSLAAHYMPQSGSVDALILTKTNARATVHRPGYMDYIGVLKFDAKGKPIAEQRFLGLYTSSAYNRRPWEIPLVRERLRIRDAASPAWRRRATAARRCAISSRRCRATSCSSPAKPNCCAPPSGILGLQERVRSKLFLRRDRYGRFFSALVYIPRDRFNTEVRTRIEADAQARAAWRTASTPPCRSANRRWRSCT